MTTSFVSLPVSIPTSRAVKKKRVLLVDTCTEKRELRADAMRKLGMDVDCACDFDEARSWWRPDLYDLVLINMKSEFGQRDKFCGDVRAAIPPQQLAFLVGKPMYVADLPNADDGSSQQPEPDLVIEEPDLASQSPAMADQSSSNWGIMAASRRISQVRSVAIAHTTAKRNRPAPPRDLEVREARRGDISKLAIELREEGLL